MVHSKVNGMVWCSAVHGQVFGTAWHGMVWYGKVLDVIYFDMV